MQMNMLQLKDALVDAISNNGEDFTSVLWTFAGTLRGKCQWLVYENVQRLLFQLYAGNTLNDRQLVIALSEWLGAFTGRGVGF